jgi:hypothetical protein
MCLFQFHHDIDIIRDASDAIDSGSKRTDNHIRSFNAFQSVKDIEEKPEIGSLLTRHGITLL